MARDIEAGKAFLRVSVREDLAGLRRTSKKLKAWGANIAKVGGALSGVSAAILGPLGAMSKMFADAGSELNRMSAQTGESVNKLSALSFAAGQLGIDMEDVRGSIEELNIRLGETIRDGTGPAAEAFRTLGLDANKLNKMLPVERFKAVSDALAAVQSETKRGFLADEIMGGDAFKMLSLMRQGSEGIEELMERGEELGLVMGKDDAAAAAKLSQAMKSVTGTLKAAAIQAGAALAPILTDLATRLSDVIGKVAGFVKENRQLVIMAAKVAAVIGGVGVAIMGVGGTLAVMGMAIGGIVSAFGAVASVLGVVLSPIGLIVAGLVGATAAFVKFTDTGKSLGSDLGGVFADLAKAIGEDFGDAFQTVKDTFGGVVDALKSGDMETAGDIAMSGLKLAVMEATKEIRSRWIEFNKFLVESLQNVAKDALDAFQEIARGANKYLDLDKATKGWMAWWQEGQVQGAINRQEAALRELEKRRDQMSHREYLEARQDITQRAADETEAAAAKSREAFDDVDDFFEGKDVFANWKSNIDEFSDAMQDSLDADLEEQQRAIAKARAELNRKLAESGAEAAADRMKEGMNDVVDRMKDASDEAKEGTKAAMTGVSAGTFSAAAARVMFAGQATSEEKQIAKNTEEMASTLRDLKRRRGGAVFA